MKKVIHNIHVKEFTLDDWATVRDFLTVADSYPQNAVVDTTVSSMETFASRSLNNHGVGLFLLNGTLFDKKTGMDYETTLGILSALVIGNPSDRGNVNHCYITAAIILPSVKKVPVPYQAGTILVQHVNEWAKARNCTNLCINVRVDGPIAGFVKKYGFEPYHYVLGKEVK